MPSPEIAALRALETAERRWADRRQLVEAAPAEEGRLAAEEAASRARLEASLKAGQDLEVRRQAMKLERRNLEEKLVKLKTQQMSLKKQDEFEAMQREIDHTIAEIGAREDEELVVLMAQDDAKVTQAEVAEEVKANLARLVRERELLAGRTAAARAELAEAEAAKATAQEAVPAPILSAWEGVRRLVRRGPWLVALQDGHRCGGCHLRVSNEIAEQVQRGIDIVRCDQCGRMLTLD